MAKIKVAFIIEIDDADANDNDIREAIDKFLERKWATLEVELEDHLRTNGLRKPLPNKWKWW